LRATYACTEEQGNPGLVFATITRAAQPATPAAAIEAAAEKVTAENVLKEVAEAVQVSQGQAVVWPHRLPHIRSATVVIAS
jgi:hypothetical protein